MGGLRQGSGAIKTQGKLSGINAFYSVRSDAAAEITGAVKYLGWLPSPGIANYPLHNPKLDRLIRSIKEGTRATHLKAGFHHALWPRSIEYFCVAKSISQPVPVHLHDTEETKSFKGGLAAYEAANNGEPFTGFKIQLGALVYNKPAKHGCLPPFNPRTFPGIFVGWRLDAGFRFRDVRLSRVQNQVVLRLKGGGHKGPLLKENTRRRKAAQAFSIKKCRVIGLDCFNNFM